VDIDADGRDPVDAEIEPSAIVKALLLEAGEEDTPKAVVHVEAQEPV
jgi:hypothetical protein